MMHNNPFSKNGVLVYLVTLTMVPALLRAAIYLCLERVADVYGEERSRFRPMRYTVLFCSCDFLALLLQAIGGAIASAAYTTSSVSFFLLPFSIICHFSNLNLTGSTLK